MESQNNEGKYKQAWVRSDNVQFCDLKSENEEINFGGEELKRMPIKYTNLISRSDKYEK